MNRSDAARVLGSIHSAAKTAAARANGRLGGRTAATVARYYEVGEHTTAFTHDGGLQPNLTCEHRHHSVRAAERCEAAHYPWTLYLVIEGRRFRARERAEYLTDLR